MQKTVNFKKGVAFVVAIVMVCAVFAGIAVYNSRTEDAFAAGETVIVLQIDNPIMTVGGAETEIDPGRGTTPLIIGDRTLVPIRAIIEAAGGEVEWDDAAQQVTLTYNGDVIRLVIDSATAYLNDAASTLDVAPTTINDRTMLPIRYIAESFEFSVNWDESARTVTITIPGDEGSGSENAATTAPQTSEQAPTVYMTGEITPESLVNVYNMLGFTPEGNVAIKLSTGEPPASNYLDPNLIKDLVQSVNGTIVECNTAYGGSRSSTAMHRQVAEDHGFTAIANVDIMDEEGYMSIPVTGGTVLTENFVGTHLANYDSMITLSHFKGHAMAGFGGAIKNMSIGVASREGKSWIHSGGTSMENPWGGDQDRFLESMAEATSAVIDYMDGKIVYVNVMNNLSVDCDCDGNPAEPDMHDIGILASTDPVALDQACIDLVYAQADGDGASLVERIESRNGLHTLEHAAKIGLGSREYNLVSIDG